MIELGLHTDNWRVLSGDFRTAAETAVKYELEHIEFAVIHGQYFVQAMGYDPAVSLQSNPRALRRYCEEKGLQVSQIDGSFPMMGPTGSSIVRLAAPDRRESSRSTRIAPDRPRRGSAFWNRSSLHGTLEACQSPPPTTPSSTPSPTAGSCPSA